MEQDPNPSQSSWALAPGPIVAHRGASGVLPEHTLCAYAYAHAAGSDWIEPDVVSTRDGQLLCLHDVVLERVTDVADRFPDRKREDGSWYAADFDLAELRQLEVTGPQGEARGHRLCTLEELLLLVSQLDRATGRRTGLMPELKRPALHRAAGLPLEEAFLQLLTRFGYSAKTAPVVVQCFELDCLERIRGELGSSLRLLFLTEAEPLGPEILADLGSKVDAIGPSRKAIEGPDSRPLGGAEWVAACHRAGLLVVPYTFDDEPEAMARFLSSYGVDALFTNFPFQGVQVRDR